MITAEKLESLTTLGPKSLAKILDKSGYSMCSFQTAKFVGITNAGQFCYLATWFDESGTGNLEKSKVFITYDHSTETMSAEF